MIIFNYYLKINILLNSDFNFINSLINPKIYIGILNIIEY